jgi:hypothetical protein
MPHSYITVSYHLHFADMRKLSDPNLILKYMPPPHSPRPQMYLSKDLRHLIMKSEADRPVKFEKMTGGLH